MFLKQEISPSSHHESVLICMICQWLIYVLFVSDITANFACVACRTHSDSQFIIIVLLKLKVTFHIIAQFEMIAEFQRKASCQYASAITNAQILEHKSKATAAIVIQLLVYITSD